MYRHYENPYVLQEQLADLQKEYESAVDEDTRIALSCDIAELKDRIRFAWDDDENG